MGDPLRSYWVQVLGSQRLRLALAAALDAGHELNEGTALGSAAGIRVDSLAKLAALKVSNPF